MSSVAKETIYLFTTTKNSLYKRDLLNVCCFADGWVVEFGYKPDYVPVPLITNPVERLDDHPVVIVFCEPVAEADIYYRYYPIRKGTIGTSRKDFSDCLTIPITLGPVFNYSSGDVDKKIEEFQKFVDGSDHRPQTRRSERLNKKPNIFVRKAEDFFPAECWQPWDRCWYSLAARMCEKKGLSDSYFVRLDPDGKAATPSRGRGFPTPVIDESGRPKWTLVAGESYELRLEVKTKAKPPVLIPSVTARGELLYTVGPFERQSGDGTRVEYVLAPKRNFQQEYSLFEVRVDPDKDGNSRSSEIGGVLEITPKSSLLWATVICLVAGTATLSLDSALLEEWFGKPDGTTYWHGKTALAIAKLVGMSLVGYGTFQGFRKLPIKT